MNDLVQLVRHTLAGLAALAALTLLLGFGYPLAVTGVAQLAMPWHADGSLVDADGDKTTDRDRAVGSALIGQPVTAQSLFVPRPSAAGDGYDPLATGGSNLGPEAAELINAIQQRQQEVADHEGVTVADVPADAVTASASGLDPHISPAYAALQVPRVAEATGLSEQEVVSLVDDHTTDRTLGVLGEPRVNVLLLNLAVRAAAGVGP